MGTMYAWATPDFLLHSMTLEQIMLFYEEGWETRKAEAAVLWGVLGQAINGDDLESGKRSIEEFRKAHPEGQIIDGAWKHSA